MNNYTIKGKITEIFPSEMGTSKSGRDWKKQNFTITTDGDYPQTICFSSLNDRVELNRGLIGMEVSIDFDIRSRDYISKQTGKKVFITELNAWRMDVLTKSEPARMPEPPVNFPISDETPDFPF